MVDDLDKNLLSLVTHDLRTPLAVVHTTTSMLLNPKYKLSPEQVREQHERIRRNVELMNRMIADLTDVVTLRSGPLSISPKAMILGDALRDAVAAQEASARDKSIVLTLNARSEALNTEADFARLVQLFQILIGNAIKASKAGDNVTVTVGTRDSRVQFEVFDRGADIAPEELPHIFDLYPSASRRHEKNGTGLGLFIAKGIVEAHGGQIFCKSEPGVGTTFTVTLPLAG